MQPFQASAIVPPPMQSSITINKVFRFFGTSDTTQAVLYSDLLAYVGLAVDTTHVTNIADIVKLNSIEAWGATQSDGSSTIAIELPANNTSIGAKSVYKSDTSLSVSFPAHVLMKVPANCSQYNWQQSSSNVAFNLYHSSLGNTNPVIVDVNISLVLSDTVLALNSRVVSGATANSMYYGPMNASAAFVPVILPTI